jgi:hypothetical protein
LVQLIGTYALAQKIVIGQPNPRCRFIIEERQKGKALPPGYRQRLMQQRAGKNDRPALGRKIGALAKDGEAGSRATVNSAILRYGVVRADKDRRWFAAMGFDIDYSGG